MRRLALVVLLFLLRAPGAYAWSWPVQGPVLLGFAFDPSHPDAGGQHRGIDVGAPTGTPVAAPAAGTISFAGTVPTSGKSVTIETADGYSVTLTHLGSIGVSKGASVGEWLDRGQPLGPSGTPELDVRRGRSTWACARPRTRRAISIRSRSCRRSRRPWPFRRLRRRRPRRRRRRSPIRRRRRPQRRRGRRRRTTPAVVDQPHARRRRRRPIRTRPTRCPPTRRRPRRHRPTRRRGATRRRPTRRPPTRRRPTRRRTGPARPVPRCRTPQRTPPAPPEATSGAGDGSAPDTSGHDRYDARAGHDGLDAPVPPAAGGDERTRERAASWI